MFKLFICMILLFGYSRVHVDVTDTGAVDRTTYGVFTLEWMVLWTVPHSVAFQCEHGLNIFFSRSSVEFPPLIGVFGLVLV